MNTTGKLVLSALSVLGLAACAVSGTDEAEVLGESQEALINGTEFYGSDTLFNAITAAISQAGLSASLDYLGTGSGKGEQCLEGTGGTPCNTKAQTIAPMSRDLQGSCDSGQKSNRIALDAIYILADDTQVATSAASANIKGAFCGDGSGSPATCANFDTWGELTTGSSNPSNAIKLYRRDDISGTTDTFKSLTGCTTFCAGVKIIVEDLIAGPRLSTDSAGTLGTPNTSSIVTYSGSPTAAAPCLQTDSATDCIGKLAGANIDALAYAGGDALRPSNPFANQAFTIDSKAPTTANIRKIITDPSNKYPLARFLYLNEGNGSRATAETNFLNWIIANPQTFENTLTASGFIACDAGNPLDCGATGTTCPRNSSLP